MILSNKAYIIFDPMIKYNMPEMKLAPLFSPPGEILFLLWGEGCSSLFVSSFRRLVSEKKDWIFFYGGPGDRQLVDHGEISFFVIESVMGLQSAYHH